MISFLLFLFALPNTRKVKYGPQRVDLFADFVDMLGDVILRPKIASPGADAPLATPLLRRCVWDPFCLG